MAKNKHELLAKRLTEILKDHLEYSEKVLISLQLIQMHFYEPFLLLGSPEPTKEFLLKMTKAHCIGLQFFSVCSEIKKACKELPCLGAILEKLCYLKKEIYYSGAGEKIIPWKVRIIMPTSQQEEIKEQLENMLLYCPDKTEFSNEIEWFEHEDCSDSINSQLHEIFNDYAAKAIIRNNLIQLAKPFYAEIIKKWRYNSEKSGSDLVSNNNITMNTTPFAPNDTDSVALAYEKVLKILKEGKCKRYYNLMILWKELLEELTFNNVSYTENQKKAFITQWYNNLFNVKPKIGKQEGRWKAGQAIYRKTAIKILLYFVDQFISDPNNKKIEGELTCFLWTLIWLSYELNSTNISLSKVLKLKTDHLKDHLELSYENHTIEISYGLHQLLSILKGTGEGKRSHYLFPILASKSRKHLENIFKKVSLELFCNEQSFLVSPSAFCSFPHSLKGVRITNKERIIHQTVIVKDNVVSTYRKNIKKAFQ